MRKGGKKKEMLKYTIYQSLGGGGFSPLPKAMYALPQGYHYKAHSGRQCYTVSVTL